VSNVQVKKVLKTTHKLVYRNFKTEIGDCSNVHLLHITILIILWKFAKFTQFSQKCN